MPLAAVLICALTLACVFASLWLSARRAARTGDQAHFAFKNKIDALVKAFPDGILILDLEGKILFESEACRRFHKGGPTVDLAGTSLYDQVSESHREEVHLFLKGLLEGRTEAMPVHNMEGYGGEHYWVQWHGSTILNEHGVADAVVVVVRDVTRRKHAEHELSEYIMRLQEASDRIAKLQQDVVSLCAWTKQVFVDGKWVSVDEYLTRHLGLKVSHDISKEGISILEKGMDGKLTGGDSLTSVERETPKA